MAISTIKLKGYKTSIQDLLDNNTFFLSNNRNKNQKLTLSKIKAKNKSCEESIKNFIKQKGNINNFKFNKIINNLKNKNNDK